MPVNEKLKSDANKLVNADLLAAILGISPRQVRNLAGQKIINPVKVNPYRFILSQSVQEFIEYKAKGSPDSESMDDEARIKKAEAEIKEQRAIREKLAAQTLQGRVHEARDVKEFTSQIFTAFRQFALALPNLCAIPTSRSNDPAVTASIIKDEVNNMLEELTKYDYEKAAYIRAARDRAALDMDADVELLDEENEAIQEN